MTDKESYLALCEKLRKLASSALLPGGCATCLAGAAAIESQQAEIARLKADRDRLREKYGENS